MHRLSEERKRWLARHADREQLRSGRERNKRRERRRGSQTGPKRRVPPRQVVIDLPRNLSLEQNFSETVAFFAKIRRNSRNSRVELRLDFTTLREIRPAAALLLVAELDLWRTRRKFRPHVIDIDNWDQDVLRLLDEMGLFDLLNVENKPNIPSTAGPVRFIKFKSSNPKTEISGEQARQLRLDLEQIPDVKKAALNHAVLYRGITEAMTNVRQHAYGGTGDSTGARRSIRRLTERRQEQKWWMFGAYDSDQKTLTCTFYDQGRGIPSRMREMHSRSTINNILSQLGLHSDEPNLIAAAMEIGRRGTRTGEEHRGYGLSDIKKFAEQATRGRLRILSGQGKYLYDSQAASDYEVTLLRERVRGTLIEWELQLP